MPDDTGRNQDQIFIHEEQVLKRISKSMKDLPCSDDEYIKLAHEYQNLLRLTKKITRLGDSYQNQLLKAKLRIEEQNRELVQMNEIVKKMALTDTLTGLDNRRALYAKVDNEIERAKRSHYPISLIIGDIDYFKKINDTHGHHIGDHVLIEVAAIFKESIRKTDIAARWGGEEFLLILPEMPLADAVIKAQTIRQKLKAEPIWYEKTAIPISMTMGVAQIKQDETLAECIQRADCALYNGKRKGRNMVLEAPETATEMFLPQEPIMHQSSISNG